MQSEHLFLVSYPNDFDNETYATRMLEMHQPVLMQYFYLKIANVHIRSKLLWSNWPTHSSNIPSGIFNTWRTVTSFDRSTDPLISPINSSCFDNSSYGKIMSHKYLENKTWRIHPIHTYMKDRHHPKNSLILMLTIKTKRNQSSSKFCWKESSVRKHV